MKPALILLLLASSCLAALTYVPDSSKSSRDADVVAIVKLSEIRETGVKKDLLDVDEKIASRALYRQFTVTLWINTLIKGDVADTIKLILYRNPTFGECVSDFGEEEGRKTWSAFGGNRVGTNVFSALPRDLGEYICYLSKNKDGTYSPLHGDAHSGISFFVLVPTLYQSRL